MQTENTEIAALSWQDSTALGAILRLDGVMRRMSGRLRRNAPGAEGLASLLPQELIACIVREVDTAKQLCTALCLCNSWRSALNPTEVEWLWEQMVRRVFPRAVAIREHLQGGTDVLRWRDQYRHQLWAEQSPAVNSTAANSRSDQTRVESFLFTVELRLDGALKASWTGPSSNHINIWMDECFLEERAQLWQLAPDRCDQWLPDWYRDVVCIEGGPEELTRSVQGDAWGDRLELTLFVTTGDGRRTGKLYSSNETEVEDFQTHWKERIGHESSGEGWCIEPLSLFDTLDDRGVIHFYLNLYKGGANVYYSDPFDYDYDRDEEAGAALLRMIERSLSPVRPDL